MDPTIGWATDMCFIPCSAPTTRRQSASGVAHPLKFMQQLAAECRGAKTAVKSWATAKSQPQRLNSWVKDGEGPGSALASRLGRQLGKGTKLMVGAKRNDKPNRAKTCVGG